MQLKPKFLLPALALALASGASAVATVPAGMNAGKIPDITVWDEANAQHSLWNELQAAGSGPVIVLPVYTRCTMSCPILARMLVQQTSQLSGGAPYRVLIFSFDPGDDAEALRQFRAQKNLPSSWILVHSSAADIRRFCDFFHYSIMTEGSVMIHTNQMFLLDRNFQWRSTFIDEQWDAAELRHLDEASGLARSFRVARNESGDAGLYRLWRNVAQPHAGHGIADQASTLIAQRKPCKIATVSARASSLELFSIEWVTCKPEDPAYRFTMGLEPIFPAYS